MAARLIVALGAALFATAAVRTPTMHHATGVFTVTVTPEAQADAPAGGVPTGRMGIAKTFTGGMIGAAVGTMLTVGVREPGQAAAYVAVDQFSGSVDGHAGGFVLLHRATMDKAGKPDMTIVIAPDTGTGALTGIAGAFAIDVRDGVHHYDLAYTLPA